MHISTYRNDVDDVVGCEKFRFAFGRDEMMMNAEAGLYFKFDEENGIPKNCEGLEHFNMENWINDNGSKYNLKWNLELNRQLVKHTQ